VTERRRWRSRRNQDSGHKARLPDHHNNNPAPPLDTRPLHR
jgi:hypothetical protein